MPALFICLLFHSLSILMEREFFVRVQPWAFVGVRRPKPVVAFCHRLLKMHAERDPGLAGFHRMHVHVVNPGGCFAGQA